MPTEIEPNFTEQNKCGALRLCFSIVHTMQLEVTKFSCFVYLIGTVFSTYMTQKHVMLQWHSHCNCGWHVETFEPLSSVASMVMLEVSQFFVAS